MGVMQPGVTLLQTAIARALGPSSALAERQAFATQIQAVLNQEGQARLVPTIVAARLAPAQGLSKGKTLVITVTNHAAMSKLRLLEPLLRTQIQRETPEITALKIVAQRAVSASPRPTAPARPSIPAPALARLRAFYSQDH